MTYGLWLFLLGLIMPATGMQAQSLQENERELVALLEGVHDASNDETKRHLNADFKDLLWETIEMEGSFDHRFDSLNIGKVTSPDDAFRIYNWNIELDNETFEYYCLIQKVDKKGVTENVIELIDNHDYISKAEFKELDPFEWIGALYYEIIPFEKNDKTYYAMVGLDINDRFSKLKMIEVLQFKNETVKLGLSVFKMKNGVQRRFMLECKADNILTMNYEKKEGMIVFNHLLPMDPRLEGQYDFYVNDLSFDAFEWDKKKEQWVFIEDVYTENDKDEETTHSDLPDWEDPEDVPVIDDRY